MLLEQLLGNANINIATFNLGRTGSGEAVSLVEIDGKIDSALLSKLKGISNVKKIKNYLFDLMSKSFNKSVITRGF